MNNYLQCSSYFVKPIITVTNHMQRKTLLYDFILVYTNMRVRMEVK